MAPKCPWTLQGHVWPIYMLLVYTSPKFHSISLYDQPFSRYRPFWDKCSEWPQIDLDNTRSNYPIPYTTVPEPQISLHFVLRPAIFELQAIFRQVHRMTPKGSWTLQDQRYTTYVLLVSSSPKFHSVLLYDQPFSKYRTFYNYPLTTMLNGPKKNKKKMPKNSKISNFTVLLTILTETLPRSIHAF